jgi:hypothetical protein
MKYGTMTGSIAAPLLLAAALPALAAGGRARAGESSLSPREVVARGGPGKTPESGNGADPAPPFENAVVTVNQRAVTRSHLRLLMSRDIKRLDRIRAERRKAGRWSAEDAQAYGRAMRNLRLAAIREVVFGEILRTEADRFVKLGMKVPEREIERFWRDQLDRAGGPGELAVKQGLSIAALKEMARDRVLAEAYRDNLRSTMARPTPREMADYYRFNSEQLRRPESVRARVIFVKRFVFDAATGRSLKRKDADKLAGGILDRLKQGMDFDKAARRYSEDPDSAANGGLLGSRKKNFLVTRGKFEPVLEKALFGTEPGGRGRVISGTENLYIVKVERHLPAGVPPLEEVEREVFVRCFADRVRQAEERLFRQAYHKVLVLDSRGRRIPLEELLPGPYRAGSQSPPAGRKT